MTLRQFHNAVKGMLPPHECFNVSVQMWEYEDYTGDPQFEIWISKSEFRVRNSTPELALADLALKLGGVLADIDIFDGEEREQAEKEDIIQDNYQRMHP